MAFKEFLVKIAKSWLKPMIIVLAMLGVLVVLARGSSIAPFVYKLF